MAALQYIELQEIYHIDYSAIYYTALILRHHIESHSIPHHPPPFYAPLLVIVIQLTLLSILWCRAQQ